MDRQSRTLHHKKQDGIKIQSVPPSIVEGQEGDMVFLEDFYMSRPIDNGINSYLLISRMTLLSFLKYLPVQHLQ